MEPHLNQHYVGPVPLKINVSPILILIGWLSRSMDLNEGVISLTGEILLIGVAVTVVAKFNL